MKALRTTIQFREDELKGKTIYTIYCLVGQALGYYTGCGEVYDCTKLSVAQSVQDKVYQAYKDPGRISTTSVWSGSPPGLDGSVSADKNEDKGGTL